MSSTPASPRDRLIVGALFVAMAMPILLIGFEAVPYDPADVNAPLWVVACCGGVFACAGLSVMIGAWPGASAEGALPASAPFALRALQHGLWVAVFAMLALIPTWIAFAGDERGFSTSVGGVESSGDVGVTAARIAFGAAAGIMWLIFIPVTLSIWRRLFPRRAQ
jgi:hypothetical protein